MTDIDFLTKVVELHPHSRKVLVGYERIEAPGRIRSAQGDSRGAKV